MIEIAEQNKMSVNQLVINDGDLPPYDFDYKFIEER